MKCLSEQLETLLAAIHEAEKINGLDEKSLLSFYGGSVTRDFKDGTVTWTDVSNCVQIEWDTTANT